MDTAEHELLASVASMYYDSAMTQNQIADELSISRVKVHRLLKSARQQDVVQVFVDWPLRRNADLEEQLAVTFGLQTVLVLQASPQARISACVQLGQLCARFLEEKLEDESTLAICLGSTTFQAIQAIRPNFRVHVNVAQALGSMPSTLGELDSAALARQLADRLGGQAIYLSAPFMADSIEDAQVLRRQRDVRRGLEAARSADLALLGVGTVDPNRSNFVRGGYLTASELALLESDGVRGDMAGNLFSTDGESYPAAVNDRVIGLTLQELRDIPTTIAVAMGDEKQASILGALRTGAIDVMATDDRTARGILSHDERSNAD